MKRLLYGILLLLAVSPALGQDTKSVLCIGNSFTYVGNSHQKLVDLAASQGHRIQMNAQYVGGFTFGRHLRRDETLNAIERAGLGASYDYVFLQNQSQLHARYAMDPARYPYVLADAKELSGRVRQYSPDAVIFLESTWSYPAGDNGGFSSLGDFDRLSDFGTEFLAEACGDKVSYIGRAFALARQECPEVPLLADDQKHQSDYGAYLKACVNYLMIFGEPFDKKASACGLDAKMAAMLREVAEHSVLGNGRPASDGAYVPKGYHLVWSDEFSGPADQLSAKWKFEDWAPRRVNRELQRYVPDDRRTAYISDGVLRIVARKEGNEVISARMNSAESWKYGYMEARIRLPKGLGTWPAYWMMPDDESARWPRCGEIDIMEEVGMNPDVVTSTIHCAAYNHARGTHRPAERLTPGAEGEFHVYALEWTEDYLRTFVDGVLLLDFPNDKTGNMDTWPFEKNFHIILNLAWGGSWGGQKGVDERTLPCAMEVDYVRVYQK